MSKLNKDRITTAIVIPDLQVPYEDKKSLAAVEKYMAAHKWDYYINIGDFMDFDMISSHNKNNLRAVESRRILADYNKGNEILDRHQKIVKKNNPDANFVLIEGNHEYRVERYIDALPQLEGILEVEKCLNLKERGFKWVRSESKGELFNLGKANFTHGTYVTKYHAAKMVENYGVNIFYGHTHDVMAYPKVMRGKDKTIVGQSLGCLCDYNQSYMKGRPSNWQQAFGVFYFYPNGMFDYYVPRLFNNRFIGPDGKSYDPN